MDLQTKSKIRSWLMGAATAGVLGPALTLGQTADFSAPASKAPAPRTNRQTVQTRKSPSSTVIIPVAYQQGDNGEIQAESEVERQLRLLYERDGREMPSMRLSPLPTPQSPPKDQTPADVPATSPATPQPANVPSAPPAARQIARPMPPAQAPAGVTEKTEAPAAGQNKVTKFFKKMIPGGNKKPATQTAATPPRQLPATPQTAAATPRPAPALPPSIGQPRQIPAAPQTVAATPRPAPAMPQTAAPAPTWQPPAQQAAAAPRQLPPAQQTAAVPPRQVSSKPNVQPMAPLYRVAQTSPTTPRPAPLQRPAVQPVAANPQQDAPPPILIQPALPAPALPEARVATVAPVVPVETAPAVPVETVPESSPVVASTPDSSAPFIPPSPLPMLTSTPAPTTAPALTFEADEPAEQAAEAPLEVVADGETVPADKTAASEQVPQEMIDDFPDPFPAEEPVAQSESQPAQSQPAQSTGPAVEPRVIEPETAATSAEQPADDDAPPITNPYTGKSLDDDLKMDDEDDDDDDLDADDAEDAGPKVPLVKFDQVRPEDSVATKMRRIIQRTDMKGFKGFCPVTLRDQRELADSVPEFVSSYRSQKFFFASKAAQIKFDQHPDRYAPAAYGADVVVLTRDQDVIEGTLDHAAWYRGHLYLFASRENHDVFVAQPEKYASPPGIE